VTCEYGDCMEKKSLPVIITVRKFGGGCKPKYIRFCSYEHTIEWLKIQMHIQNKQKVEATKSTFVQQEKNL
jgi:hypothetical protein